MGGLNEDVTRMLYIRIYIHTYILGGAVRAQGNGILFCRACLNKRMLYNDVSRALSPLVGLFGTSVPNMGHHGPV